MIASLGELLGYVGLGIDDHSRLTALHARLAPDFPAIADRFYAAVTRCPATAPLVVGTEQVRRLHAIVIDWMRTGLVGPYDDRFYAQRSRIARSLVQVGIEQPYTFIAMNVVRTAYHDRIVALYPPAEACVVLRAVNKLHDLELAIMVQHYQLECHDQLVVRERHAHSQRFTALQTMTAGLAHEVRNPLNSAKLQLELLGRRLQSDRAESRLLEPVERAMTEIQRLTALLNDFLEFAGPPELHAQDHDLVQLVAQVCELERPAAEARGATLGFAAAAAGRQRARVDGLKLTTAVHNLVRNAIEAVAHGGHVTVELAATATANSVVVSDDGPGIPVEHRARIFEPFFSTKESGTGLGLSIAQSLVGLHGGTIGFDTSPRGTSFEIVLPRAPL